ncbi:hypothetical protein HOY80DRAFT_950728 [Tuber brumale]|nr:hypothetical protein HOY80DRAFT_950728 [Tuber brumale]
MKFTLIAAVSALSTLATGLTISDQTFLACKPIFPECACVIREDFPDTSFPTDYVEVSRNNGQHNVKTLLKFTLPAFRAGVKCKISFISPYSSGGSRRMQLFTTIEPTNCRNTWNQKPSTNNHIGTFQATQPPPPTVIEDFGLTFDCPTVPTKYGYEVQPVGDYDWVTWNIRTGGFVITPQC